MKTSLPCLLLLLCALPLMAGIRTGGHYSIANADFTNGLNSWAQHSGSGVEPFSASSGPHGDATAVKVDVPAGDHGTLSRLESLASLDIASPTLQRLGQKLELGGWLYLPAASTFTSGGSVFLQLHSVRNGADTKIAQSEVLNLNTAPRDRWIYLYTSPTTPYDARIRSKATDLRITLRVQTQGELYFDDLVLGKFDYSEYPLENRSFEHGGERPVGLATIPGWDVVSGLAKLNQEGAEPDAYYGTRYLKLQGDQLTKVRQILWLDEGVGAARARQTPEAGAWVFLENDVDLQSGKVLKLEVFAGAQIASVLYKPTVQDSGKWIFLHTELDTADPIPVSSDHIRVEFTKQMAGTVRLDYVQVGELHGINGNPQKHVACNYLGNNRNLLYVDHDLFPPPTCPGQAWRNWYSEYRPYSDSDETLFQHNPDASDAPRWCTAPAPDGFRPPDNVKRDIAISPARNPENVPLAGAYDSRDGDVIRYHIRLAQAVGIDSFVFDHYGQTVTQEAIATGLEPVRAQAFEELVLASEELGFKLAVMYEPKVHFNGWIPHADMQSRKQGIQDDLVHIVDTYYDRKPLLKHDGRMVVYLFGHRQCESGSGLCLEDSDWQEIRNYVRDHSQGGRELYFIGGWIPEGLDYTDPGAWYPRLNGIMKWDLVDLSIMEYRSYTKLINGTTSNPPIGKLIARAGKLNETIEQWARQDDRDRIDVPIVWPGFDDRGVAGWGQPNMTGEDGEPLSVRVTSEFGGTFLKTTFESVLERDFDWVHLVTWNDWNESTALEPRWRRDYVEAVYAGQQSSQPLLNEVYGHLLETQLRIATFKSLKYGKQLRPEEIYGTAESYLLDALHDPSVIAYD